MNERDAAVRMARDAEQSHRTAMWARRETAKRLMELRLFCAAYGIDFQEVRSEAKDGGRNGHGQAERQERAS